MNISKETIKILEEQYIISFIDDNLRDSTPEKATQLAVHWEKIDNTGNNDNDLLYVGEYIKAPKKEITIDYVANKISKKSVFKNFCNYFNGIIEKYRFNAYPTSYGIGIFVILGFRDNINETKYLIESSLNELGIEFKTEYSDAHWVFRYKISKSTENIKRIERLLK